MHDASPSRTHAELVSIVRSGRFSVMQDASQGTQRNVGVSLAHLARPSRFFPALQFPIADLAVFIAKILRFSHPGSCGFCIPHLATIASQSYNHHIPILHPSHRLRCNIVIHDLANYRLPDLTHNFCFHRSRRVTRLTIIS